MYFPELFSSALTNRWTTTGKIKIEKRTKRKCKKTADEIRIR